MRSKHQKRVDEFMRLAEQDVPTEPTRPSETIRILRAKLILEEALETIIKGLGVIITFNDEYDLGGKYSRQPIEDFFSFKVNESLDFDMIETIDGCCDLMVVTTGTLSAIGVPDEPFQFAVDANNLAKFGPGGYRREDGKWMKPPGHQPPDIQGIINQVTLSKEGTEFCECFMVLPEEMTSDGRCSKCGRFPAETIQEEETMRKAGVVQMEDGETPDNKNDIPIPTEGITKPWDGGVYLTLRLDKGHPDPKYTHCCRMAARAFQRASYDKGYELQHQGIEILKIVEGIEQS